MVPMQWFQANNLSITGRFLKTSGMVLIHTCHGRLSYITPLNFACSHKKNGRMCLFVDIYKNISSQVIFLVIDIDLSAGLQINTGKLLLLSVYQYWCDIQGLFFLNNQWVHSNAFSLCLRYCASNYKAYRATNKLFWREEHRLSLIHICYFDLNNTFFSTSSPINTCPFPKE